MNETTNQPRRPETLLSTEQVKAIWAEYERTHDVTHLYGKAYGIDLETGEIYFGESKTDIDNQHKAAGRYPRSLYLSRVGVGYYAHARPGRRCR
jgi:hypothetical protein